MKVAKIAFLSVFFLVLLLPGLQMRFSLFNEEELHGVEENKKLDFPSFSLNEFLRERYQSALTKWFSHEFGFRGHLVRSDNQLNYSLFRILSANYASPLVVGKNSTLFERLYIDAYNHNELLTEKSLRRVGMRLRILQELLKKRGIQFLLLITPSKASIYPERIPARFLKQRASDQSHTNYLRLLPILQAKQINYFDTREYLLKLKETSSAPLFARGGTHWTQNTACMVTKELMTRLSAMLGKSLQPLSCEPTEIRQVPEPFDRDLADLANIWHPEVFYEKLPYPVIPEQITISGYQPRLLFTGGSFLWTILYYLEKFKVHSTREMFYYFSRDFRYPSGDVQPINRRDLDWQNLVFSNDAIILEVNEANMSRIGAGFISAAIDALQPSSSEKSSSTPSKSRDDADEDSAEPTSPNSANKAM